MDWSLAKFTVNKLLDGRAFPSFRAHELQLYNTAGEILGNDTSDALYLPYINFNCIVAQDPSFAQYLSGYNDTGLVPNTTQWVIG